MREMHENLTSVRLEDFTPGMSLYVTRLNNNYPDTYACEFISLKRGIVAARAFKHSHNGNEWKACDFILRTAKRNCFLYGQIPKSSQCYHAYSKEKGWT